jgi:hypothetical protein
MADSSMCAVEISAALTKIRKLLDGIISKIGCYESQGKETSRNFRNITRRLAFLNDTIAAFDIRMENYRMEPHEQFSMDLTTSMLWCEILVIKLDYSLESTCHTSEKTPLLAKRIRMVIPKRTKPLEELIELQTSAFHLLISAYEWYVPEPIYYFDI